MCEVGIGERYYEWELVAVLTAPEPLAVVERNFDRWGLLAYLGMNGPVATMRKTIGNLDALPEMRRSFPPEYFDRLLDAREDVLGKQVLSAEGEPSYEAVAGLLPPLSGYTFLGTPSSREKIIVLPDGRLKRFPSRGGRKDLEGVIFDPWEVWSALEANFPPRDEVHLIAKQGLIGGYLPAVDFGFWDLVRRWGWEQMTFAVGEEELHVHVCLRSSDGKRFYWLLPSPQPSEDGTDFYRALLTLWRRWEAFFGAGMDVDLPEPRVMDAGRAGIARALITGVGVHPKYGVGGYWDSRHDTFPPTTWYLGTCLLEWGFAEETKARLGYYLSRFVGQDGTFNYYGPAVSEYGQMLALAARCVRLTKDVSWLREHLPPLERIVNHLFAERAASRRRLTPDAPQYGLLWGAAEADNRDQPNFYFSGDVWCWRGLVELGRLLIEVGRQNHDDDWRRFGERCLAEAEDYRQDILRALHRAWREDVEPPFLSPVAGWDQPFDRMTQDRFASYTNYRYWLEMLSAGLLPPEMRDAIIAYRLSHGGELLGMTRFMGHLDDWPYAHYAWGMLSADRVEHYLLGFYAHLAHHQTPGTFTAYEQVGIRGNAERHNVADYCVPSQLVVPLLLRWMLVWEGWDEEGLWLARAAPRRWFASGFGVHRAPTRWGTVEFIVTPIERGLTVRIEFDSPHPRPDIYLRLRSPYPEPFRFIQVNGAERRRWEPKREVLHLQGVAERITIQVSLSQGV